MPYAATILIVGGASRIGEALTTQLGARARAVVRQGPAGPGTVVVEDYARIPDEAFAGIERVVNCVGVTDGPPSLLDQINVSLPTALARKAKSAGAVQFVQISSFSVYGGADIIAKGTPPRPDGAYGASKLKADQALLDLATAGFAVTCLRLPLVYDQGAMGKLGQLLKVWCKVGLLPVPKGDVKRAMIAAPLAAEVIGEILAQPPRTGVSFAADPAPFTYRDAARSRPERLRCLSLPAILTAAIGRVAPALGRRLFSDSDLAPSDNLAVETGRTSRLYADIAAMAI